MKNSMECLKCRSTLPTAVRLQGDGPPGNGDIAICLHCKSIMVYCDNGKSLRCFSEKEANAALEDGELMAALATVDEVRRRLGITVAWRGEVI